MKIYLILFFLIAPTFLKSEPFDQTILQNMTKLLSSTHHKSEINYTSAVKKMTTHPEIYLESILGNPNLRVYVKLNAALVLSELKTTESSESLRRFASSPNGHPMVRRSAITGYVRGLPVEVKNNISSDLNGILLEKEFISYTQKVLSEERIRKSSPEFPDKSKTNLQFSPNHGHKK